MENNELTSLIRENLVLESLSADNVEKVVRFSALPVQPGVAAI